MPNVGVAMWNRGRRDWPLTLDSRNGWRQWLSEKS